MQAIASRWRFTAPLPRVAFAAILMCVDAAGHWPPLGRADRMRMRVIGVVFASTLLLAGCGGGSTDGPHDANEVLETQGGNAAKREQSQMTIDDSKLTFKEVQLKDYSMEIPLEMLESVPSYDLTAKSNLIFKGKEEAEGRTARLMISTMEGQKGKKLKDISSAEQQDVNGIKMAVDREIVGDTMDYKVDFIHKGTIYRLNLIYSSELDPRYGDYAGKFFKTIKMNE